MENRQEEGVHREGRAPAPPARWVRWLQRTPGGNLCAQWWLLALAMSVMPLALPPSAQRSVLGVTGAIVFLSWLGYPLLLVFQTPSAHPSRRVRLATLTTVGVILGALGLGATNHAPWLSLVGFLAMIVLFTLGAHVLGVAEHRAGRYQPLNSFWAVVAMLYLPVGVIYVHNRWRRVTAA